MRATRNENKRQDNAEQKEAAPRTSNIRAISQDPEK